MSTKYYSKYKKYKTKYLESGDGRYSCDETKQFKDICYESKDGMYKTMESCVNDCEGKYIYHQLSKANLRKETNAFYKFISGLIDKKYNVYVKGGAVIGLELLKLMDENTNDNIKFNEYLQNFLNLNLIRDWDFLCYTGNNFKEDSEKSEFNKEMNTFASQYGMVRKGGKNLRLYQQKNPIMVDKTDALFELDVRDKSVITDMEIPLATMKVKVTKYNIKYIFIASKIFLMRQNNVEYDIDIIRRIIGKINIIIDPSSNGFYLLKKSDVVTAGLSDKMLDIFRNHAKSDWGVFQFLITHIIEPNRLIYRLVEKNLVKTRKIVKFIGDNELNKKIIPSWLLDSDMVLKLIRGVTKEIGIVMTQVYDEYDEYNDSNFMESVDMFLSGVNLDRIEQVYDETGDIGKELVKNMFGLLGKQINIDKMADSSKNGRVGKLLRFLNKKKIFD